MFSYTLEQKILTSSIIYMFSSPAVSECPGGWCVQHLSWQPETSQRIWATSRMRAPSRDGCLLLMLLLLLLLEAVLLLTVSWLIPGNSCLLALIKGAHDALCCRPRSLLRSHPIIINFTWKTAEETLCHHLRYSKPLALRILVVVGCYFFVYLKVKITKWLFWPRTCGDWRGGC